MIAGSNSQHPHRITLVTAPGCHLCEDAHQALTRLAADGADLDIELVEATSPAGLALLAAHRPPMNPLVLLDGDYFSAGRFPRRKLQALLDANPGRLKSMAARHG